MKKSTLYLHPSFTVAAVDPRVFGGFLEHLGRAVYEGVYDPRSKFADEQGCRTDVLDALRRLKFTAMRYPGGNFVSGYHWEDAVGPRECRPVTRDLAWQSLETNEFGPNEFLTLSKQMGWTPMLAVNLGTGTPEEARNWLEYCNVDKGGKYANMRIEHGYQNPFDVKLWCLGNEMDGHWQLGHVPADQYAIKAQQTANMMRMCDPSVELVVCGSCSMDLPTYLEWDRIVLEHCRDYVDHISVHRYVGNYENDTESYLGVSKSIDDQIDSTAAVCAAVRSTKKFKKQIGISFDEWNVWYRANKPEHMDGRGKFAPPLIEEVYNLEDALVAAEFLNSFIRHADVVKIANLAQIVNVIAPILTKENDLLLQSIFFAIEMIANRGEGIALRQSIVGDTYEAKKYGEVSIIDTSAILNGSNLHVNIINRSVTETTEVTVNTSTASVKALLSAEILTGPNADATNTYEKRDTVISKMFEDVKIKDGTVTLQLPPLSLFSGTFSLAL